LTQTNPKKDLIENKADHRDIKNHSKIVKSSYVVVDNITFISYPFYLKFENMQK